jgi:hypothetical protein
MAQSGSSSYKQQVHTEARSPIEVVLARVVYYVFGVIEVIIAARFVLMLFGANPNAGFVSFIYSLSGLFMAPFNTVFKTQTAGGATFEWSALVAMAVYAVIGWGIVKLIYVVTPRRSSQAVERVEQSVDTTARQ